MEERPAKRLRDNGPEVELSRSEEDKTDTEDGDLQKETAPVTELLVSSEPSTSQINLLNLQVEEYLRELAFEYDNENIQKVLQKLQKAISKIPTGDLNSRTCFLSSYSPKSQRPLRFGSPDAIEVGGDFATKTLAAPDASLDIWLTIPATCFLHKDHLNHQYHIRRALYLAGIALELNKLAIFRTQHWEFHQQNPRKPILVVTPKLKKGHLPKGFAIRLHTCLHASVFPLDKLKATKNNLRSAATSTNDATLPPTPLYNASILAIKEVNTFSQDIVPNTVTSAVGRASSLLPNFPNAVLLLKAWSRHSAGEISRHDAWDVLLPAFAADMAIRETLARAMSPVQIFRAVLKAFSDGRTFNPSYFMQREEKGSALPPPPPPMNFHSSSDVIFVEPSGWLNIATHLSRSSLTQMQCVARRTAALLDHVTSGEQCFESVFLRKSPPPALYDIFWRINLPMPEATSLLASDPSAWRTQERELHSLVAKALGSRVSLLRTFERQLSQQQNLRPPELAKQSILVAAKLKMEHAYRAVDIGPSADSPSAAEFRHFWVSKAEMRRFQDGRICEAVAWDVGPSQRHAIPDLIVGHIVRSHIPGSEVQTSSTCLDWSLRRKNGTTDDQVIARRQIDAAIVKLGKQLRSLTKLALKVTAVQPISATARHTSGFTPLPHPYASGSALRTDRVERCIEPVPLLIQLEGSGRWPDAPQAFLKMKAALGVQLAEELFTGFGIRVDASEEYLDAFADGFVFRLFLCSERDAAMAARDSSFAADFQQKQRQATHHGMVLQLSAAHPTFRAAAQLASRWISAQLMSNHVAPEAVELITAAAYCPDSVHEAPGSPLAGFIAFLRTLAIHRWKEQPLLVDPDSSMDTPTRQSAAASLRRARTEGIAPGMPIATAADPASSHWTPTRPAKSVVQRLAALARRSLGILEDYILKGGLPANMLGVTVFDPLLCDYDVIILLRRESVPKSDMALLHPNGKGRLLTKFLATSGFPGDKEDGIVPSKNARASLRTIPQEVIDAWGNEGITRELLVGFDPVAIFLEKLESRFKHLGRFFADLNGGEVIAIKWDPEVFKPQPFHPETAHTSQPIHLSSGIAKPAKKKASLGKRQADLLVIPSICRVISDIKMMGAGLVADVRLKQSLEP